MKLDAICVYCGSSLGNNPDFAETAFAFGTLLAEKKIRLIYGGGNVGTMGALAEGALAAGGDVVGVIPQTLVDMEVAHHTLTELHIVKTMQTRKAKMAELADAFVALPGGIGTFEEIFEVITMTQLGIHLKPCAFLNHGGFYDLLLQFLESVVSHGFITPEHYEAILSEGHPEALIHRLAQYQHMPLNKRIERL